MLRALGGGGGGGGRNFPFYLNPVILRKMPEKIFLKDLSEISRGGRGGGGWKQREGHNFLRLRKGGGVMKNRPLREGGSCKYVRLII